MSAVLCAAVIRQFLCDASECVRQRWTFSLCGQILWTVICCFVLPVFRTNDSVELTISDPLNMTVAFQHTS